MRGWFVAVVLAAIFLAALPASAAADQGEYRLVQCHHYWNDRSGDSACHGRCRATTTLSTTANTATRTAGSRSRRSEAVGGGNHKQYTLTAPTGTQAYLRLHRSQPAAREQQPPGDPRVPRVPAPGGGRRWPDGLEQRSVLRPRPRPADLPHASATEGPGAALPTDQARMMVRNLDVIVSDRTNSGTHGLQRRRCFRRAPGCVERRPFIRPRTTRPVPASRCWRSASTGRRSDRRTNGCPGSGDLGLQLRGCLQCLPGRPRSRSISLNTANPPFVNGKSNTRQRRRTRLSRQRRRRCSHWDLGR